MTDHELQPLAHAIRFLAIDAIVRAGEGHQGVPLGMAEIATALYARHLKHCPSDPTWWDRDRVVLSNGHGSMLLYALLHLTGYERISLDEIRRFRELGSHCAGHPEYDPAAGIEVTTGPLGQGIANAFGMAVAEAYLNAKFGSGLVDHFTYAFVGDGCLQEGIGQEMISLAGHLRLGKLVLLWDDNRITDDGPTALSISEDVAERFRVAGWHVAEVDGHDIEAVSAALDAARADPRPSMLACRTTIGRGIPRVQGRREGHSARLHPEDAAAARELLHWPHPAFEVPAPVLPERMVGCADLEAPTSHKRSLQAFTAEERGGAYVHCGVREHLMGAMANGMAAHGGIVPLAVTYLAFSDYERPAMRMAALMGLPGKFVFSHDSIGIGRNGPTHQPVEILASLRAMPNMLVMRPADAVEAAECWAVALAHRSGPVSLVFARQALPAVRTRHVPEN
ncbi:MAG TPA: transketolase family protein, partial [Ramlibacter sp.]